MEIALSIIIIMPFVLMSLWFVAGIVQTMHILLRRGDR